MKISNIIMADHCVLPSEVRAHNLPDPWPSTPIAHKHCLIVGRAVRVVFQSCWCEKRKSVSPAKESTQE